MFGRKTHSGAASRQRLFEADPKSILIAAGDECDARGCANGGVRVRLKESHARRGETVDVRRGEIGPAVASDVRVPEIVGKDEDDVGTSGRRLSEELVSTGRERDGAHGRAPQVLSVRSCDRVMTLLPTCAQGPGPAEAGHYRSNAAGSGSVRLQPDQALGQPVPSTSSISNAWS